MAWLSIQELIWSAPYRNPFPRCSDKVIWGLKSVKDVAGQEECVERDALMLIDLRRGLCELLASLRASEKEENELVQLENNLDGTLVKYISTAWKDEQHFEPLDHQALSSQIKEYLEPTGEPVGSSLSLVDNACRTDSDGKTESSNAELVNEKEDGSDLHGGELFREETRKVEYVEEDLLNVEITFKARLCLEEQSWHAVFGLINHSSNNVDVEALSFWPQDRESEVTTIRWPKGDVVLNEASSFICYSVKVPANALDSPRLCFSWNYKRSLKPGKRSRTETKDLCQCPWKSDEANACSPGPGSSFAKRVRRLFNWS